MTTLLSLLLHAYQPPTQDLEILRKISDESYKPVLKIIDEFDISRFSINVNGILIEMLTDHGLSDVVEFLKCLYSSQKIEVLGTSKYHPILPLIPEKEIYRQIKLNEQLNEVTFGKNWNKRGFFPPEMAISLPTLEIIKEMGYQWIICSGMAFPSGETDQRWPNQQIYSSAKGLLTFYRDDILSNKIAFNHTTAKNLFQELKDMNDSTSKSKVKDKYVILALDIETYGHHLKNYESTFLKKLLTLISEDQEVQLVTISELTKRFPINEQILIPRNSSWSTNPEDLAMNVPYPLWNHPQNDIHHFYWKIMKSLDNLMFLADQLDLEKEGWEVNNYYTTARYFYDRSLYSCPMWWANPLRGAFSPNLIYKGLELIMKAALNAQLALEYGGNQSGEGYFDSISYYQGLILMEIYSVARKTVNYTKCNSD